MRERRLPRERRRRARALDQRVATEPAEPDADDKRGGDRERRRRATGVRPLARVAGAAAAASSRAGIGSASTGSSASRSSAFCCAHVRDARSERRIGARAPPRPARPARARAGRRRRHGRRRRRSARGSRFVLAISLDDAQRRRAARRSAGAACPARATAATSRFRRGSTARWRFPRSASLRPRRAAAPRADRRKAGRSAGRAPSARRDRAGWRGREAATTALPGSASIDTFAASRRASASWLTWTLCMIVNSHARRSLPVAPQPPLLPRPRQRVLDEVVGAGTHRRSARAHSGAVAESRRRAPDAGGRKGPRRHAPSKGRRYGLATCQTLLTPSPVLSPAF